ncbi:MAG: BadF/BadG/BcrA/BcrD ATPase family protein [Pirellulales bacterium]
MQPRLLLGIDGGGSKTAAWVSSIDSLGECCLLGQGLGGPANFRAAGRERALESLDEAVDAAFQTVDLKELAESDPPLQIDTAVMALAGSALPDVQAQVLDWARERSLAAHLHIAHDAEPVLSAGTPDNWGIALIAGTGSAAIGRDQAGQSVTVGGWGYWFGDQGSGFSLGQMALAAAAKAADGLGPATALQSLLLKRLQIEQPRKLLSVLIEAGDVRRQIARLAPLVMEAAEQADPVAQSIVKQGVSELATLVQGATGQLGWSDTFPLALAGGVVCGSPYFRHQLEQQLASIGLHPDPITPVDTPVAGCVKIAAAMVLDR